MNCYWIVSEGCLRDEVFALNTRSHSRGATCRRVVIPDDEPLRLRRQVMKPTLFTIATVLALVTGVIPTAHAVECAAGVVRAGCAGPNGAVVAGPRGSAATGTNGMRMRSTPRAGATATGVHGNTATKAVAPGCAFVN